MKHQSKASTLNNMSKLLMLITEGTDSLIGRIDKGESTKSYWSMCIPICTELRQIEFVFIPICTELRQFEFVFIPIRTELRQFKFVYCLVLASQRELQLTVIQSRFKQKESFHRKCVYLVNQQFDDRTQYAV